MRLRCEWNVMWRMVSVSVSIGIGIGIGIGVGIETELWFLLLIPYWLAEM